MASPRRKTHRRPTFSATEPHFLKIIPEGTSKHSKLMIPRTFLMKCGDELSNPVLLKLPSGAEWKVELRKWDDELWFGKGWPKFFEYYSIGFSYSLVFRYEGNSKFRVCIFDKDSTEIDYPLTIPEMSKTDEDDGSDDNTSEDNSRDDSILLRSRKKEKSKLPYPRNHKKNRTSSIDKGHFRAKRYSQGESDTPNYQKMTQPVGRMNLSLAGGKATALQRAKAFKSGNPSFIVPIYHSYISKKFVWLPSRFSIHMKRLSKNSGAIKVRVLDGRTWSLVLQYEKANRQKHKLHYGWREFVQGNDLKAGDVCVLVLIDEIRLTFEVVIFRAIVAANSLSPQDTDGQEEMPEMESTDEDDDPLEMLDEVPPYSKRMKKSPIAPQPHKKDTRVFGGSYKTPSRVNPRPEVCSRRKRGKHRALERAKAFKSEHPSCTVVMCHSYIHAHYVNLGVNFIKEHLVNRTEYAILRVSSGRTWPVKLANQKKYEARFRAGWMTFVRDNQLDIGDVCVFVLIDDIKVLVDVVIFRSREAANCTSSPDSNGEQRMFQIKETDEDDDSIERLDDPSCAKRRNNPPVAPPKHKRYSIRAKKDTKHVGKSFRIHNLLKQGPEITANDRALQRAKAFKSDYPSCTVVLHPSYVFAGYLHLKASFTKEHFLKQKHVILRALDGRTWLVILHKHKETVRFYGGWMSFVQDNHLKVHDVCVFVLVNHIELVMDVVIFRAVEAANCTLSPDYDEEQSMSQMEESDEDDDFLEFLDDFPSCSRRANKLPVAPQPQHHKRTEENYNTDHAASSSRTKKLFKRTPAMTSSGKYRALQRAIAFKSEYPSCTVVMKSSYIVASYLYLGVRFNEKHLLNREGDNVILRVDGRTWTVQLGKRDKLVRLQSGWKPFVEDNHLEIGDVCVFMLVDDIKLLLDVVLFRAGEAENCTSSPDNQHPRSVQVEEVEDELHVDRKMEAEYLTVDTTSESE